MVHHYKLTICSQHSLLHSMAGMVRCLLVAIFLHEEHWAEIEHAKKIILSS